MSQVTPRPQKILKLNRSNHHAPTEKNESEKIPEILLQKRHKNAPEKLLGSADAWRDSNLKILDHFQGKNHPLYVEPRCLATDQLKAIAYHRVDSRFIVRNPPGNSLNCHAAVASVVNSRKQKNGLYDPFTSSRPTLKTIYRRSSLRLPTMDTIYHRAAI